MASANATKVEKSQTGIRWARDDLWLNPKGCKQWLIKAAKSLNTLVHGMCSTTGSTERRDQVISK